MKKKIIISVIIAVLLLLFFIVFIKCNCPKNRWIPSLANPMHWTCRLCGEEQYDWTLNNKICSTCANKTGRCKHCGKIKFFN